MRRACRAISNLWSLSRAFEAPGTRLRTFYAPMRVPIEPLRRLARQAEPRRVGDAKSGRIASMQNMLAAQPTVGRIPYRQMLTFLSGLGATMAKVAGARIWGWS